MKLNRLRLQQRGEGRRHSLRRLTQRYVIEANAPALHLNAHVGERHSLRVELRTFHRLRLDRAHHHVHAAGDFSHHRDVSGRAPHVRHATGLRRRRGHARHHVERLLQAQQVEVRRVPRDATDDDFRHQPFGMENVVRERTHAALRVFAHRVVDDRAAIQQAHQSARRKRGARQVPEFPDRHHVLRAL